MSRVPRPVRRSPRYADFMTLKVIAAHGFLFGIGQTSQSGKVKFVGELFRVRYLRQAIDEVIVARP